MTGHSILSAHITNAIWFGRSSALSLSLPRLLPCILHHQTLTLMLFEALSAAFYGIDANIIDVEVDFPEIKTDQDHFYTVGLPDAAVRERCDRVRAAIKNSGFDVPSTAMSPSHAPRCH